MSAARLFRPFDRVAVQNQAARRHGLRQMRGMVDAIREKVLTGQPLSDADHRLLAKCGPNVQRYVGYSPLVTLA